MTDHPEGGLGYSSWPGRARYSSQTELLGLDTDDRATNPDLFAELQSRFGTFTLDVAASAANTKCARYFTAGDDGLSQSWARELVWCNPPYSSIQPWVAKPFRDRPGTGLRCEFLPGRIKFIKAGRDTVGPNERTPFGCCLLIWSRT